MITDAVLRQGLLALATAYNRKADTLLERTYRHALRELSDAQFRFAVDEVLRESRWFPPPAALLEAGFGAPVPVRPVGDLFALPPAPWQANIPQSRVESWVRSNPIDKHETPLHYVVRIAEHAGLVEPGAGILDERAS